MDKRLPAASLGQAVEKALATAGSIEDAFMRRFFVPSEALQEKTAVIRGDDALHLNHVLRLRPGDEVELFDGTGSICRAVIDTVGSAAASVSIVSRFRSSRESPLAITLAVGFLKDKKMDALMRQLTELGIRRFLPFFCRRSVPRPDGERLEKRRGRWEKIAREAVKQCRRGYVPEISPVMNFAEMISEGRTEPCKFFFWENGTEAIPTSLAGKTPESTFLVVGPEGGFTEAEAESAREAGYRIAALGPRILRAETAAVAVCATVQYLLGDMGPEKP
jgi:16S rRNA (uracil1498-N3)-methyltransferase